MRHKRYQLITTIVADPPWRYGDAINAKAGIRGASTQYHDMTTPEICAVLPRALEEAACRIAGDAHLYLWTTNAFIADAHEVARRWGFAPKTVVTWVKGRLEVVGPKRVETTRRGDQAVTTPYARLVAQIGQGHYFANNTEHVLFCVRGRLRTKVRGVPTAFIAPRPREKGKKDGGDGKAIHSAKPPAFGELVEKMSPGPYLEMFSRRTRPGWRAVGLRSRRARRAVCASAVKGISFHTMRDDARANLGERLRHRVIAVDGHYFVELGAVGNFEHIVAGALPTGLWVNGFAVCGADVDGRPRATMDLGRVCSACLATVCQTVAPRLAESVQ